MTYIPAAPQLTLSIGSDSAQTTFALVTEGATPGGGVGGYTYAWTLERDDSTDGTSLLSDATAQAPTWTPDLAGWWEVCCTVTSGTATVVASRRVLVSVHQQSISGLLSTIVSAPS